MPKYLFLFTIGPVQSFIAQARKTQDLYAGSQMLSSLIDEALRWLISEKKVLSDQDLIFPAATVESKPNRLLCLVESDDIQQVGNELKRHLEDFFVNTISEKVLEQATQREEIEAQLRDFLKMYWVAQPANAIEQDYGKHITAIERLMGAVKNVRYFDQFEEKGRKCSLNGEYNVKFYRKNERDIHKSTAKKTWKERKFLFDEDIVYYETQPNGNNVTLKHIQEGEGLCAVSFAKRLYKTDKIESFPSVAYIALKDTLKQLCDTNIVSYCEFVNLITEKEKKEYQFLYEENHTETKLASANIMQGATRSNFDEKYKVLQRDIKDKNLKLAKYYAILAFDADGMGQKLAECKTAKEHEDLSSLLGKFATAASTYLDSGNKGKTVYAGGDDFLGFVNLNHLFEVLKDLRELFDDKVNKKLTELDYTHLKLTFSAGVAIAHYKHPLGEVLSYARQMEKKAKKIDGISTQPTKNAFAIAVLKHSGEIHETVWKWKNEKGEKWITDLFLQTITLMKQEDLADQFIRVLGVQFNSLINKNGELKEELHPLLEMELKRTILRASDKSNALTMRTLADNWFSIFEEGKGVIEDNFNNWIHGLQICEFIQKELNPINSLEN